jgi:hypothetical protein
MTPRLLHAWAAAGAAAAGWGAGDSRRATPGTADGAVRTVKMEGSGWSKLTALTAHTVGKHEGRWEKGAAELQECCRASPAGQMLAGAKHRGRAHMPLCVFRPPVACGPLQAVFNAGKHTQPTWAELGEVVLVRRVVSMPGDHVERGERLSGCVAGMGGRSGQQLRSSAQKRSTWRTCGWPIGSGSCFVAPAATCTP